MSQLDSLEVYRYHRDNVAMRFAAQSPVTLDELRTAAVAEMGICATTQEIDELTSGAAAFLRGRGHEVRP